MNITVIPIRASGSLMNTAQLRNAVVRAVRDMTAEGTRYMAEYPPVQPGQRYKRTGTLKRSWSATPVRVTSDGAEGIVGSSSNIAPYNKDVQGPGGEQQPYFRGLWQNVDDLIAKSQDELPRRVQAAVDEAAG